jgi:diadenosine tetraphosphatase ApaH/serine/threonine PP2A family protein phosphatase
MRIALLSDIHSNLEALEAVLAESDALGANAVYCLGDVVGYGASPNECVERIRERASLCLAGNHDHAAVDLLDAEGFNEDARRAVSWTAHALSPENAAYLRSLPLTQRSRDVLYVHAAPSEPGAWDYILRLDDARYEFEQAQVRLCFFGHTHRQVAYEQRDGHVGLVSRLEFAADDGARYLVNVGSVGQPRDGDPRAAFTIYDEERETVRFLRVAYDIQKAAQRIAAAGLPDLLAYRLLLGR